MPKSAVLVIRGKPSGKGKACPHEVSNRGRHRKVDVANDKLDHLTTTLEGFIERVTKRSK